MQKRQFQPNLSYCETHLARLQWIFDEEKRWALDRKALDRNGIRMTLTAKRERAGLSGNLTLILLTFCWAFRYKSKSSCETPGGSTRPSFGSSSAWGVSVTKKRRFSLKTSSKPHYKLSEKKTKEDPMMSISGGHYRPIFRQILESNWLRSLRSRRNSHLIIHFCLPSLSVLLFVSVSLSVSLWSWPILSTNCLHRILIMEFGGKKPSNAALSLTNLCI